MSEFEKAIENVKNLKNITDLQKLSLYGLYKQAIIGDINIPKPSFWNRIGLAKWNAWNNYKNLTHDEAKDKYVELVKRLER